MHIDSLRNLPLQTLPLSEPRPNIVKRQAVSDKISHLTNRKATNPVTIPERNVVRVYLLVSRTRKLANWRDIVNVLLGERFVISFAVVSGIVSFFFFGQIFITYWSGELMLVECRFSKI